MLKNRGITIFMGFTAYFNFDSKIYNYWYSNMQNLDW